MSLDKPLLSCADTLNDDIDEIVNDRPIATFEPLCVSKLIGGVKKSRLTILGGKPGCGKTTLCDVIKTSLAAQDIAVAYYSYEMPRPSLTAKSISRLSGGELRVKDLPYANESEEAKAILDKAKEAYRAIAKNIFCFDRQADIVEISKSIGDIQHETGKQAALIVDYTQLIPAPTGESLDERTQIGKAIAGLRSIANEYKVPVFAISSITRADYKKSRASLDCLAGSQAIEYASDTVLFISSDEAKNNDGFSPLHGKEQGVLVTAIKNRFEESGSVHLVFDPEYATFRERN